MSVDLYQFDNSWYSPGRSWFVRAVWYLMNVLFLKNPLNPSSTLKVVVLSLFGAKIGCGVNLKPSVNIKYPWNLEIGDHTWIGEGAWLDSLDKITIGSHCCISQDAYLCTGNHNWTDPFFGLIVKPITIEDAAWIGTHAIILPGVTVKQNSIVTAGSVVSKDTEPNMIYTGNPAIAVKERIFKSSDL